MIESLSTLDAHAHIHPARSAEDVAGAGVVLAMSFSIDDATRAIARSDPNVVWSVGCHPSLPKAQESFDGGLFRDLAERAAAIGEIGLDGTSRVPLDVQLSTFREALAIAAALSRPASIHSRQATALVLQELRRTPVPVPILHWWTGSIAETRAAVAMGCYFSIHSAVARHSRFRTAVPLERVLVESDQGWSDPPATIPSRIQWVESLVAEQFGLRVTDLRLITWRNFARIVADVGISRLLPQPLAASLAGLV